MWFWLLSSRDIYWMLRYARPMGKVGGCWGDMTLGEPFPLAQTTANIPPLAGHPFELVQELLGFFSENADSTERKNILRQLQSLMLRGLFIYLVNKSRIKSLSWIGGDAGRLYSMQGKGMLNSSPVRGPGEPEYSNRPGSLSYLEKEVPKHSLPKINFTHFAFVFKN